MKRITTLAVIAALAGCAAQPARSDKAGIVLRAVVGKVPEWLRP
jgi:hypothetical protein